VSEISGFLPLDKAAVALGVPAAWLRAEAEAGRIPIIRAGRQMLANVRTLERVLNRRSMVESRCSGERND